MFNFLLDLIGFNKDDKDSDSDSDSDSDNETEVTFLIDDNEKSHKSNKRKDVLYKTKRKEALIVDTSGIDIEICLQKETIIKPKEQPISIRSGVGSFEIQREGTECYMDECTFYTDFINRITRLPEYRKATSISWPSYIPPNITTLFSRQLDYISLDMINLYYRLYKNTGCSGKLGKFIEESIREDTPWIIHHLNSEN
jgi:hypothetical protein